MLVLCTKALMILKLILISKLTIYRNIKTTITYGIEMKAYKEDYLLQEYKEDNVVEMKVEFLYSNWHEKFGGFCCLICWDLGIFDIFPFFILIEDEFGHM